MDTRSIFDFQISEALDKIKKFEDNIRAFYQKVKNNKGPIKEFGYLIEKNLFDELKSKILGSDEKFQGPKMINYKTGEQADFQNYKEMEDALRAGKEYIIVDFNIWDLLNNKEKERNIGKLKYEINSQYLVLFIKDEKAFFSHNSNILNYTNLIKEGNENENIKENKENTREFTFNPKKTILSCDKKTDKSNKFLKNIEILIELYFFNQEIQNKIKEENKSNGSINLDYMIECYLIKEDWFTKNNYFNLYNQIYQNIINNNKYKGKKNEFIIEDIIKTNKFNFKENNNIINRTIYEPEPFKIEFKLNYDKNEIIFLSKYVLINKTIYNQIINDNNIDSKSIDALKFFISNKKMIIKYQGKNILLIGNIKSIYNIFIPYFILKYDDQSYFQKIFADIKNYDFSKIDNFKDKAIDYILDEEDKTKKVGKYFLIDKNKYMQLDEYLENIFLNLDNNYKELEVMNQENYYIINNKYIKKLKEMIKYNEYLKIIEENQKKNPNIQYNTKKIIDNNRSILDIDKNVITIKLENIDSLKLEKENIEEGNIFYYKEFEIISEKLKYCLMNYDLLPLELELIQVRCKIKNNKIIFYPILPNKYFIFICSKDDKNDYISEILYEFKDLTKLNKYLNTDIKENLMFKDKKCEILSNEGNLDGTAYQLGKINNNENWEEIKIKDDILNIIKIYLFNKDLDNKINLSKLEIIGDENNSEKNIFSDKCFLINLKNFDSYINYYLYGELEKYFNEYIDKNEKGKIQKDSKGNLYLHENINFLYNLFKNSYLFEKYKKLDIFRIEKEMFEIKKSKVPNEDKISYYNNFYIVNEEIYKYYSLTLKSISNERKYIINSGKIIVFFEDDNNYQILFGKVKSNSINFDLLIDLKDNTCFNILQCNLLKKNYNNEIIKIKEQNNNISIFELTNDDKKEIMGKYKKIRYIALIYIFKEHIIQNIKVSKIDNKRNYYIVNKELIEQLNEIYEYDIIINKLKKNEEFITYLNKYIYGEKQKFDRDAFKDLMKLICNDDNFKEFTNKISESMTIAPEMNEEILKSNSDSREIIYYNKFCFIDDNIKKILEDIFQTSSVKKSFIEIKCLMHKNNIYIFYSIDKNYIINVCKFIDNLIFDTKIIIEIYNEAIHKNLFDQKIIEKEIYPYVDRLINDDSKDLIKIKNSEKEIIGIAYKLLKIREKSITKDITKEIIKEDKNKINIKPIIVKNINSINNNGLHLQFLNKNNSNKEKFSFNKINMEFEDSKVKNKMIKLFVILLIDYKEIEETIEKDIKTNGKKVYYLINKDFLKIYKKYYNFEKIQKFLNSSKQKNNFVHYFDLIISLKKMGCNYDKYIYELIKNFPNDNLELLEYKKKNQEELYKKLNIFGLNTTAYPIEKSKYKFNGKDNLVYYGENEIVSEEFYKLFIDIETYKLKTLIEKESEKINCFIGEGKIYIPEKTNKYPLLNIGKYENNIFKPNILIIYKNEIKFSSLIFKLENQSFGDFMKQFNLDSSNEIDIKDYLKEEIIGKICKLSQNNKEKKYNDETKEKSNDKDIDKFLNVKDTKSVDIPTLNSENLKIIKLIVYLKKFMDEKNQVLKTRN